MSIQYLEYLTNDINSFVPCYKERAITPYQPLDGGNTQMTNEDVLTMTRSVCLNYKDRPVRTSQDTENLFYKPESSRDSLNTTTVSRMWLLDHWSAYDLTVCICLIRIPHQRAVVVVVINTIVIIIVVTHIAYERENSTFNISWSLKFKEQSCIAFRSSTLRVIHVCISPNN